MLYYSIDACDLVGNTVDNEDVVCALLAHYVPAKQICKYLKISKQIFIDNYSHLDNYEKALEPNEAVENALFKAAAEGNNQSMMFWLKNKAGWDDGKAEKEAAEQEALKDIHIDRIQLELISKDTILKKVSKDVNISESQDEDSKD